MINLWLNIITQIFTPKYEALCQSTVYSTSNRLILLLHPFHFLRWKFDLQISFCLGALDPALVFPTKKGFAA